MAVAETQITLDTVPSHFNWNLEDGTNKTFETLKQQLDDHIKQNPDQMTVPAYLFMSFLHMSKFNATTNYKDANKYLQVAFNKIDCLTAKNTPSWIGYMTVAKGNEAIIESKGHYRRNSPPTRNVQKCIETIKELLSKKTDESEAYVHIVRAFALSRLGLSKYEEAQKYYQYAVDIVSDNPEWLFGLALTIGRRARQYLGYGKQKLPQAMQKEKQLYERVLSIDENHALACCYLAQVLLREGNSEDALQYCLRATSISGTYPSVLRIVGRIFRREGLYENALKVFQHCEQDGKGSSYLYHHWGLVYRDMCKGRSTNQRGGGIGGHGANNRRRGNRGCSVSGGGGGTRAAGNRSGSYNVAGNTRRGINENTHIPQSGSDFCANAVEAIRKFEKALECNPTNTMALLDKARMHQRMGNMDAARDDYDEFVRMRDISNNDKVTAHYNYGLFLQSTFQDEVNQYEAIEHFRSAIECALQNCTITWYPGSGGFHRPKFSERVDRDVSCAISKFKALAKQLSESQNNEKRCDGLRQLAWVNLELGHVPEAKAIYTECIQCEDNANDVQALQGLAKCFLQKGDFSEAETVIEKLTSLNTQIAKNCKLESRMRQGRNALQNKKNAEARRFFLEILDLDSVDCCDDLFTTLQSCSTYERGQWEFCADCAKLAYTHSDYYLKHPEEMAERLSEIDLNQHSSNEKVTIASFSERVESLMDLGHSELGTLRNKHFQMEQTILKQATIRGENKATLDAVAEVLAEIRAMLGHTMTAFKKKHYPESKPLSNPYYYVPAELAPKTEEEVKTTLLRRFEKDYKWTEPVLFSVKFPELLDFLVKIQPAYHPKNNWIRAVAKINNRAKHDSALWYAAYDLPKLYVKGNDDNAVPVEETICPSTSKQPRVKASTDGSCSENKTQKKGKEEEASLTSTNGAGIGSDTIYERYWVRDLARKATTEVGYIVAEFYKYI